MGYGQFCPIAKATEILGEKWTLLILRELLMGGSRFNELQRGLPLISPAVLSKRLKSLETHGLVFRRRLAGQKGYAYLPAQSARELEPVLKSLGDWGMRWAREEMADSDYDVGLLMLYLERSVRPESLPGEETTLRFHFEDLPEHPDWWILIAGDQVDVCTTNPQRDVDVHFRTTVRKMTEVWMGDTSYRAAIRAGDLELVGPRALTRDVSAWLEGCPFSADPSTREAVEILPPARGRAD